MADPTEQDHNERITLRLHKDHPDPAMRAQLYDAGKLTADVRVLLGHTDDDAPVERVSAPCAPPRPGRQRD